LSACLKLGLRKVFEKTGKEKFFCKSAITWLRFLISTHFSSASLLGPRSLLFLIKNNYIKKRPSQRPAGLLKTLAK